MLEIEYQTCLIMSLLLVKVSKGAKVRNRYNQVPHMTHDTKLGIEFRTLDSIRQAKFTQFNCDEIRR